MRLGPLLVIAACCVGPLRAADDPAFFEAKIRPLLIEQCQKCHGADKQKGGLRLDSRAGLLKGGDRGPAVVPGKPGDSLLLTAVHYTDEELKMPPAKKLTATQVGDLERWVKSGAVWPAGPEAAPVRRSGLQVTEKDRAHWAFQRVRRPGVPRTRAVEQARNPIDAFIQVKLEEKGLAPNPPATRRELIRRLSYDLLGLPPTPEEVEAFVNDPSPDAYEKLVDHYLDSPRYGEKWGRHWLDLVRFAETNSYERDNPKPSAWRYRDYVIRSFNEDRPYDQFVREQLAGDELPGRTNDSIIATGYYRLGIWDDEPTDPLLARYDGLDDVVTTTGQVVLGLTLDCARCHDHKIDPIPQRDYYRFLAFFQNINPYRNGGPTDEAPLLLDGADQSAFEAELVAREARRKEIKTVLGALESEFLRLYTGPPPGEKILARLIQSDGLRLLGPERFERYKELKQQLAELDRRKISSATALCVTEAGGKAPDTHVLLRGNPHVPGEKVEPGFPEVLGAPAPALPTPTGAARTTGRRSVLAAWIAGTDNPLTARVVVNRVWQYHFGRGIVRSASNFGVQGDRPTHPELLDWLAAEFVERGWRFKALHRLILTSRTYQQSAHGNPQALEADVANDLFWRFDPRRLTAEEVRDSILAVDGSLNLKMYGPGVYPEMPREVLAGQSRPGDGWGKSPPAEQNRRSVYIHVKRSLLVPVLESFDLAETDRTTPVRFVTTQPTQALGLLNSDWIHRQAETLAARLAREAPGGVHEQVRRGVSLVTTRPPTEEEVRRGVDFIVTLRQRDQVQTAAALSYYCLLLLNLNEFVYLD